jgi:hypothetical protein
MEIEIGGRLLAAIALGVLGVLVVEWWRFRARGRP